MTFFLSFLYSVLHWSIAMSTICCHSSWVVAFLQAVNRPKFRGPRSASIARSQVWLGLPIGRFQFGQYLSDSRCKGLLVILARWTASNMAEEPQTSISHQARKRWTTSGSSDFRIWHITRSAVGRSPSPVRWPGICCLTTSETHRSVPAFPEEAKDASVSECSLDT